LGDSKNKTQNMKVNLKTGYSPKKIKDKIFMVL